MCKQLAWKLAVVRAERVEQFLLPQLMRNWQGLHKLISIKKAGE